MMETIKLILNLFRCRFIFIQTYFGQLHTPFRKPRHDPRDGSVLYPQLYSIEIENVNVISKFLIFIERSRKIRRLKPSLTC